MFVSPTPPSFLEVTLPTPAAARGLGRGGRAGEVAPSARTAPGGGKRLFCLCNAPKAFSISAAPSALHPSPLVPGLQLRPPGERLWPGADSIWGRRVLFSALRPSARRASFPGAGSPAGIDVKRRRSAAYRRLTRALLHTPFLPRPLPLLRSRAPARYKRREPGAPGSDEFQHHGEPPPAPAAPPGRRPAADATSAGRACPGGRRSPAASPGHLLCRRGRFPREGADRSAAGGLEEAQE